MTQASRRRAETIFLAGVAAADPAASTASALRALDLRAGPGGRIAVLAVGKAAFGMTRAAVETLDEMPSGRVRPADILVVTHDEAKRARQRDRSGPGAERLAVPDLPPRREAEAAGGRPAPGADRFAISPDTSLDGAVGRRKTRQGPLRSFKAPDDDLASGEPRGQIEVLRSGHPLPDERGRAAAREFERRASELGAADVALVLISGGASAMLPAPAPGIGLKEKLEVTRQLLRGAATIHELNAVRKHLSTIKGGGLLRQLRPARVVTLALSDVIDDDPSVIGSGPTAPDPSTFEDACGVLRRCGAPATFPASVRARFEAGVRGELTETPKPGDAIFDGGVYRIVGGNRTSVRAMAAACGEGVVVEPGPLVGEAREVGARLAMRLAGAPPRAWVGGGETTVTVRGRGAGGRNQELALAFALAAAKGPLAVRRDWVFLAAGTDGRDGPTDAAGGIVDASTLERIRRADVDPQAALADNDSYRALDAADALLRTGATGTNVADAAVFLSGA